MDFSLSILGSIIFGYWCARIIEFILTDLFSNTLTNVILCISMVYLIFYIGKAERGPPNAHLHICLLYTSDAADETSTV